MTRPNITPGDWSWQKRGKHGAVCMLNAYDGEGCAKNILEVYGHIEPCHPEAKVISAIPALLAALEKVATMNERAGEIGAGKLMQIVTESRQALISAGYTFDH